MARMVPLVVLGQRAVARGDEPHHREAPLGSDFGLKAGLPRKQGAIDSQSTVASEGAGSSVASDSDEPKTTVQVRNVPPTFSRGMLLNLLDMQGFGARYNFVYLPVDFSTEESLGYAFINFVHAEDAARFRNLLNVPGPPGLQREEPCCNTTWSLWQGLSENIKRYRNSPVMGRGVPDDFKPALFSGGKRIAFPRPTKKVKEPRVRKDLVRRTDGLDGEQA
jgi:RNA recognition motif-containing protein